MSGTTRASQQVTAGSPADELDPRLVKTSPVRGLLTNSTMLVLLVDVILIAFFAIVSRDHIFWSIPNAESLLRNGSEILVLSLGICLLMSAGIFDLSVGANLILSSVICAYAIQYGVAAGSDPVFACVFGLLVAVISGILFGTINGLIITKLKVNSLIATLGTLGVGSGIAQILTNGQDLRGFPSILQTHFAVAKIGIVGVPILCGLILMAGLWALFRFTRFGMRTLAIGSNSVGAMRAGIDVDRHLIVLAAIAGALAGFAGFISLARYGSTTIASHSLDGLNAVTAVVIGGTALTGGRVSVIGTLWGVALSVILLSGLIIIRVQPFWQLVATGLVLIAAVAFDQFRARHLERR